MLVYSLGSWQDGYGKFPDALFSLGPCRWHMPWTTNLTTPKKCTIWFIVHSISGTLVYSLAFFFGFLSGTNPLRIAFCSVFRCCNPSNKRLERLEQGWFRAWCLHHFLEYIYIYLLIYLFIIYGLMFVYTVYIYMICWYQAERYQLQHECRSTAAKNSAFVTYRHQPAADSVAIYGESVEAAWCKLNTVCFLRHVLLNILHCFTYFQAFKLFSRGSAPFL